MPPRARRLRAIPLCRIRCKAFHALVCMFYAVVDWPLCTWGIGAVGFSVGDGCPLHVRMSRSPCAGTTQSKKEPDQRFFYVLKTANTDVPRNHSRSSPW